MRKLRLKPIRRNAPCPACLDRNALNLVGQPAFVNGVRLTAGCEQCGGKGRIDEAEQLHTRALWTAYRKDTAKRKAYRPTPLEPGPGIRIHLP